MLKRIIFSILILIMVAGMVSSVSADDSAGDVLANASIEDSVEMSQSVPDDVLNAQDDGTFTSLQSKINDAAEGSTIYLDNDYYYNDDFGSVKGVVINKTLTINGKGHVIDGMSKSRQIHIYSGANGVVLKNIVFKNGNRDYGGAVNWKGSKGILTDCDFVNCSASTSGGAIYWSGGNGAVTKCDFSDCSAVYGGVICWYGVDGRIIGCSFDNCCADKDGGAIDWETANGQVCNCSFNNSSAGYGGAIYFNSIGGIVTGCSFINSAADIMGGAISIGKGNCTVIYCNFTNSIAGTIGGSIVVVGDKCKIDNLNFINSSSGIDGGGGAIYWYGTEGILIKSNFYNASASAGGAIYWHGYDGYISYCNFTSGLAGKYGGFLLWEGEYGELTNCNFISSYAVYGGAVCWNGNYGTLRSSNFDSNQANFSGAVYWCGTNGILTDCNFDDCFANNSGGAVYWRAANGIVTKCSFINSHADFGGAIAWDVDGGAISYCNFDNCTCDCEGGAIYLDGIGGVLDSCNFTNCRSIGNGTGGQTYVFNEDGSFTESIMVYFSYGGAISWNGDDSSISNCNFINCSNKDHGGAMYWKSKNGTLTNSNFISCSARYGGAIRWAGDEGVISDCRFINCSANEEGGAIEDFKHHHAIINSEFTNCLAGDCGGAVYGENYLNGGFVKNCIFTNNSAKNGGAIMGVTAIDCTFNRNNASENGGAVYKGAVNLDCIFANNAAGIEGDDTYDSTSINLVLNVPSFISTYNSGNRLLILLTNRGNPIDDANSTIMVYKNNVLVGTYHCLSGEGWAVNLAPGSYVVACSVRGPNYELNSNSTLTVSPAASKIYAPAVSTIYDVNKYLTITLKDAKNGPISGADVLVYLNGVKNLKTDTNGQIKIPIKGLVPKAYSVKIIFNGNANYLKSSVNVRVVVKKATPKMVAVKKTFKLNVKLKLYSVTLKNNMGKAMGNARITVKVNGKTFVGKTNAKGIATFKITNLKKKGTFRATVRYAGSVYYNPVARNVVLTVR